MHRTTQNNWRWFNICALSFLKKNGYAIDDDLLKSHLLWIASYHAGNGWYLEQSYNYYTISLFVVYGTIWNRTFGDQYYPEIAALLERSFEELMKTYANFFGRNGYINMWARSICYRLWISGGFPVSFMLKAGPALDAGWATRLCSGSILQFLGREDFFENDIPSLGFYGHREFAIRLFWEQDLFPPRLAKNSPCHTVRMAQRRRQVSTVDRLPERLRDAALRRSAVRFLPG